MDVAIWLEFQGEWNGAVVCMNGSGPGSEQVGGWIEGRWGWRIRWETGRAFLEVWQQVGQDFGGDLLRRESFVGVDEDDYCEFFGRNEDEPGAYACHVAVVADCLVSAFVFQEKPADSVGGRFVDAGNRGLHGVDGLVLQDAFLVREVRFEVEETEPDQVVGAAEGGRTAGVVEGVKGNGFSI